MEQNQQPIRVNTYSEKRALKTLRKGLALVGLTTDDLINMKTIIDDNLMLKAENDRLKKELGVSENGTSKSEIHNYLSQKEELR